MDSQWSDQARSEIMALAADPSCSQVEFNLMDVVYVSSPFLRICLETAKALHLRHSSFEITHCQPVIFKTFSLAGFDQLFPVR